MSFAPLRVLTLNLWNRQGPYDRRLALLRAHLTALAPDVIGLQEVLRHDTLPPDQAAALADVLPGGYHVAYGAACHLGAGLHFGNAILSRWPIVATQHFTLPAGPDVEPGHPDHDEPRGLLHAEIDAPFGPLPVFVTHLNWRLHHGAIRCRQVAFLDDTIAALAPRGGPRERFPPILLGDFNAEPDSDELRFLTGLHVLDGRSTFYTDCFRAVGRGPGETFCRRNPYTAVAREYDRRLDYILTRGPDRHGRGEPLACRVVLDEPEGGVWPSDHFGVLAELSVTPRPLPSEE